MSGVVAFASQNVGPVFFLVRGIYNLYKALKDPFNIPRSWEVHPYDAYETKALYGEIPKSCVHSLRKGKSCLNSCAQVVSEKVREKTNGFITSFNLNNNGWGTFTHSQCDKPIRVRTYERSGGDDRQSSCSFSRMEIPASCKGVLK